MGRDHDAVAEETVAFAGIEGGRKRQLADDRAFGDEVGDAIGDRQAKLVGRMAGRLIVGIDLVDVGRTVDGGLGGGRRIVARRIARLPRPEAIVQAIPRGAAGLWVGPVGQLALFGRCQNRLGSKRIEASAAHLPQAVFGAVDLQAPLGLPAVRRDDGRRDQAEIARPRIELQAVKDRHGIVSPAEIGRRGQGRQGRARAAAVGQAVIAPALVDHHRIGAQP